MKKTFIICNPAAGAGLAHERWSKLKGCQRVIMIHMSDLMPEEVKGMYLKNGYEKLETHYIKEI